MGIKVPPGRAGMSPALALSYDSDAFRRSAGVGAGWSLGVPSIARSTDQGFPARQRVGGRLSYDNGDSARFVGPSGRMVRSELGESITRSVGGTIFVPARETAPVRYEFSAASDRWVEHLPSGAKRYYGAASGRAARIKNELGTHAWLLLEEVDTDGNTVEYDYHFIASQSRINTHEAQPVPLLKSVKWGGNARAGLDHMFRIETSVEDDNFGQLDMLGGHVLLTARIVSIAVYGPRVATPSDGGEELYWTYALNQTRSDVSNRLLLRSVDFTPGDGSDTTRTAFDYTGKPGTFGGSTETACDSATREVFGEKRLLSSNPEVFRQGTAISTLRGPNRRYVDVPFDLLRSGRPFDSLTPEYASQGFKFVDINSDGQNDILYHPAGIKTPGSRLLQHKSHVADDGEWRPIANSRDEGFGEYLGIPGQLLTSNLADIDGDTDPDAMAFAIRWAKPLLPRGAEEYVDVFGYSDDPLSIDNLTPTQKQHAFMLALSPSIQPGPINCGMWLNIPSGNAVRTDFGDLVGYTPNPTGPDPIFAGQWGFIGAGGIPCIDGINRTRTYPILSTSTSVRIARNTARGPGEVYTTRIHGWPMDVTRTFMWSIRPKLSYECRYAENMGLCNPRPEDTELAFDILNDPNAGPGDPRMLWNATPNPGSDFYAPTADVNGDGRADIVLLKRMQVYGEDQFDFVPRVFISDGTDFHSDSLEVRSFTPLPIDVTGLFSGLTLEDIGAWRNFNRSLRPALAALLPGDELSEGLLSSLGPSARSQALDIMTAYSGAARDDVETQRAMSSALLAVFDSDLQSRYSRPVFSLQGMLRQVAKDFGAGWWFDWFGTWLGFDINQVPDVRLDFSDVLFTRDGRTYLLMNDLLGRLRNLDTIIDSIARASGVFDIDIEEALDGRERAEAIFGSFEVVQNFAQLVSSVAGLVDPSLWFTAGTEQALSGFTESATDILREGDNTYCVPGIQAPEDCDHQMTYPQTVNFNSFLADMNGDGLPELVAAARPSRRTSADIFRNDYKVCGPGHQVHLNRGYRWDRYNEWLARSTVREDWSPPPYQVRELELSRGDYALDRLRGHPSCQGKPGLKESAISIGIEGYTDWPTEGASLVDINADGLVDVVYAGFVRGALGGPANSILEQHIYLNTGRGFAKAVQSAHPTSDLLGPDGINASQPWCGLPSDTAFIDYDQSRGVALESDIARLVDVDSDGLVDVAYRGRCTGGLNTPQDCLPATWRRNLGEVPDLMRRVTEHNGAWTEIDYLAGSSTAAKAQGTVVRAGHLPVGQQVVAEVRSAAGGTGGNWTFLDRNDVERITLSYDNFVRQESSSKAVGFETVTARFYNEYQGVPDTTPTVTTTATYDIRADVPGSSIKHALKGALVASEITDHIGGAVMRSSNNFAVSTLQDGVTRVRPRQALTALVQNGVEVVSGTENQDFDDFGYPRRVVSGRAGSAGIIEPDPETVSEELQYEHREGSWWLGRASWTQKRGYSQNIDGSAVQDAVLSETDLTYYPDGRLWKSTTLLDEQDRCTGDREESVTTYSYNALGLSEQIAVNSRVAELRYDPLGLNVERRWVDSPATPIRPSVRIEESMSYDPRFSLVTAYTDPNGNTDETVYDGYGTTLTELGAGGAVLATHEHYRDPGEPNTTWSTLYTEPGTSYTVGRFSDGSGAVKASYRFDGFFANILRTEYTRHDALGRLRESYLPGSPTENGSVSPDELSYRYDYDGLDRTTTEQLPDDVRQIARSYGARILNGRAHSTVTTTNPRGFATTRIRDAKGRLTRVERYGAQNRLVAAFDYVRDGLGRIVEVDDSDGSVRNLQFNTAGALVAANLPHVGAPPAPRTFCYDNYGELVSGSTPAGRSVSMFRDSLGRIERTEAEYDGDTAVTTFEYDCSQDENSLGRLCDMHSESGSIHYEYDDLDRQSGFEFAIDPSLADELPNALIRGDLVYGLAGQLLDATYQGVGNADDEHGIHFEHDVIGRTTGLSVSTPNGQRRTLVESTEFDEFDRVRTVELGNGVAVGREFDRATGFLTSSSFSRPDGSRFAGIEYPLADYDANGNPRRELRADASGNLESEKVHAFDALDRLGASRLIMQGQVRSDQTFDYSSAGNVESATGSSRADYRYESAASAQAVSAIENETSLRELYYDPDGWLSSDVTFTEDDDGQPFVEERTLKYDAAGCLRETEVTRGVEGSPGATHTTRNVCGLSSQRLLRESTDAYGHTQRTYYLPGNVELRLGEGNDESGLMMFRLPVSDVTVAQLAWNVRDGDIVEAESGYVHTDLRGSVLARTSLDRNEATEYVREAEYGAWGETYEYEDVETPRYGFTGEEADPGTGYYYFGARVYDPTLRRWLSPDPLILGVPDIGQDFGDQLNLYQYAANNPVSLVDRDGTFAWALAFTPPGQAALAATGKAIAFVGSAALVALGIVTAQNAAETQPVGPPAGPPPPSNPANNNNGDGSEIPAEAIIAAAAAGGGAGGGDDGGDGPEDGESTQEHHSDPMFMGGEKKQGLTTMSTSQHKQLHRDMNNFLRTKTNAQGQHMRPQSNNSGARIRQRFTRQERLRALAEFYTKYGNKYPKAARDFFKQHPKLKPKPPSTPKPPPPQRPNPPKAPKKPNESATR